MKAFLSVDHHTIKLL